MLGLFTGAAVWAIATVQAAGRPLLSVLTPAAWTALLPATIQWPLARLRGNSRPSADEHRTARLLFEAAVAGFFAVATRRHGATPELAAALLFAGPLLLILLVDWWTRYIYTGVVLAGGGLGLAVALARGLEALAASALAALGAGLVFLGAYWLARTLYDTERDDEAPFGAGDVSLAAMIGAMAGFPGVVTALFTGAVLAATAGFLLVLTRRRSRHDPIPYGAFLCLGALLTFLIEGV